MLACGLSGSLILLHLKLKPLLHCELIFFLLVSAFLSLPSKAQIHLQDIFFIYSFQSHKGNIDRELSIHKWNELLNHSYYNLGTRQSSKDVLKLLHKLFAQEGMTPVNGV